MFRSDRTYQLSLGRNSLCQSLIELPRATALEIIKHLIKAGLKRAGYRLERLRQPTAKGPLDARDAPQLTDVDIGFHVGGWRYRVPANLMVGRPCFGYGPNSWHPFVETAKQLLDNPNLDYKDSALNQLYRAWQPETIADAHFPSNMSPHPILSQMPARTLFEPWQLRPPPCDNPLDPKCSIAGSPLHGPVDQELGTKEFTRIQSIIESIERHGYDPDGFPRGLITGILLKHDGQKRFLVVHGQHRSAVLTAMGREEILVGIRGDGPSIIDSNDAENWPHVKSGLVSSEAAIAQLARYFNIGSTDDPAFRVREVVES